MTKRRRESSVKKAKKRVDKKEGVSRTEVEKGRSGIGIHSMEIRGEIGEEVVFEMCFEGVQARYDTKMSREGIPAAWGGVREGLFSNS